jgi:hypothetical protein
MRMRPLESSNYDPRHGPELTWTVEIFWVDRKPEWRRGWCGWLSGQSEAFGLGASRKDRQSSELAGSHAIHTAISHPFRPQNALPRVGTLMMRLSIGNTPATACVIFSARLRRLPSQVVPASVTLPLATDTDTPKGAIATLMCSTSAELIFASRSLLASADRDVKVSRNHRPSDSLQTAVTQASTDSRSVPRLDDQSFDAGLLKGRYLRQARRAPSFAQQAAP